MLGGHFYNQTIRRAVAVFGTLFNDINVVRRDGSGNVLNIIKVPLAYGPRQKFLARIEEQALLNDPNIAIKLPRMSFEITSMSYDPNTKLVKGQTQSLPSTNADIRKTTMGHVGYRMGMQLNIIAKNQDDSLQILEQIIPHFQPQYTVTVKQVQDNIISDMPFTLQGVTLSDDYEGDYATRRALVYTLDFETRVRFYGDIVEQGIIKRTKTTFFNNTIEDDVKQIIREDLIVNPDDDTDVIAKTVGVVPNLSTLTVSNATGFVVNQNVVGLTSGSAAVVSAIDGNNIDIILADGLFEIGETLSVQGGVNSSTITAISEQWD